MLVHVLCTTEDEIVERGLRWERQGHVPPGVINDVTKVCRLDVDIVIVVVSDETTVELITVLVVTKVLGVEEIVVTLVWVTGIVVTGTVVVVVVVVVVLASAYLSIGPLST